MPYRQQAQVVTEARRSMSEDIAYRQRRYLIMMGIRAVCFIVAVVLFVNHLGWLTAIPAVGAIVIPYFAVIFANGGREPTGVSRFQAYEPRLPDRFSLPAPPHRSAESRPAHEGPAGPGPDSAPGGTGPSAGP